MPTGGTSSTGYRIDWSRRAWRYSGPAGRPVPPSAVQATGMNAAAVLLDAAVAEGHGARPALRTPGGIVSYADLQGLAGRVAAGLHSRGVERGDRVALLLPDGVEWAAAFFGILRVGAVAVPLNPRIPA